MSNRPARRLVTVSGSLRDPSTTSALLAALADEVVSQEDAEVQVEAVELAPLASDLAVALTGGETSAAVQAALGTVAAADILVVATPIYRGSYTGLFKLFFDLVHQDDLEGTPVLLAAGGGSDQHALAIDHELRPLFAFFRARTAPIGVYARPGDYLREPTGARVDPDGALPAAIARAVASLS